MSDNDMQDEGVANQGEGAEPVPGAEAGQGEGAEAGQGEGAEAGAEAGQGEGADPMSDATEEIREDAVKDTVHGENQDNGNDNANEDGVIGKGNSKDNDGDDDGGTAITSVYIVTSALIVCVALLYYTSHIINKRLEQLETTKPVIVAVSESLISILLIFFLMIFLWGVLFFRLIEIVLYLLFGWCMNANYILEIIKFKYNPLFQSIKFLYKTITMLTIAYIFIRILLLIYYIVTTNNNDNDFMERDKETYVLHYKILMYLSTLILIACYLLSLYIHFKAE